MPRLVAATRRGLGLAFIDTAHDLTSSSIPLISLAVLAATSIHGVALLALGSVVAGLVLIHIVPFRFSPTGEDEAGNDGPTAVAHRRLRPPPAAAGTPR